MYDISGIISQFGFEFQKKVFINYVLRKMDIGVQLKYESMDDVSYSDNGLYGSSINEYLVQCKTGDLSYSTFKHVFENWIILEGQNEYTLFSENTLSFIYDFKNLRKDIYHDVKDYVLAGKHNKKCILYKIYLKYDKFSKITSLKQFIKDLNHITDNFYLKVGNIDAINTENERLFYLSHCADLTIDYAKKSRFDMFDTYIMQELNCAIANKTPFTIDQVAYVKVVNESIKRFNDTKYDFSYYDFKESKYNKYKKLENSREALFLKKITSSKEIIAKYLTEELYYKNLREYYLEIGKNNNINGVEETAFLNYLEEKEQLDNYRDVFLNTIDKEIDKTFLDNKYYNHGCYIYLSSDDAVQEEFFIDWCGENAKE